jgi:phage terminase large subunit-like protein
VTQGGAVFPREGRGGPFRGAAGLATGKKKKGRISGRKTHKKENVAESLLDYLASLPPEDLEEALAELGEEDAQALYVAEKHNWANWARPEQLPPPGDWRFWLCIAGRGGGKTRTGAEWVIETAGQNPGCRIGLLAATAADARDTMVKAILDCSPPCFRPRYSVSNRRLVWPNESYATTYSADEPEQSRGANLHHGWADELAKFRDVAGSGGQVTAWENFVLAVRLGVTPQVVVTTTPRRTGRGAEIVKDLTLGKKVGGHRAVFVPKGNPAAWCPRPNTVVHRWSTDRNRAHLAHSFLADLDQSYAGTTLEAQERRGEILEAPEGALWTPEIIDAARVQGVPRLTRLLVAVDPSHSSSGAGDEAGIIVGGLGEDGHAYVVDDRSLRGSPLAWAQAAVTAYNEFRADGIVYETTMVQTDRGGNVVQDTISAVDPDKRVRWIPVHASRDKCTRAEPVAALYEQGRVHHVNALEVLEDEMVSWEPSSKMSPNRLDALVWLVTALLIRDKKKPPIAFF